MESSSPSSDAPDRADCSWGTKSTERSGNYFPVEDFSSCEEIHLEDTTNGVCSSGEPIPPVRSAWGPNRKRPDPQELLQKGPDNIHRLDIIVAWDDHHDTEKPSVHGHQQLVDKCPKDERKLVKDRRDGPLEWMNTHPNIHLNDEKSPNKKKETDTEEIQRMTTDDDSDFLEFTPVEDLRLCSYSPPHRAEDQGQQRCQDLPACKQSDDEKESAQTESKAMDNECDSFKLTVVDEFLPRSSSPPPPDPEEGAPISQPTSSLPVGQVFRWLQKKVLTMVTRSPDSEQHGKKKGRRFRGKKIQPEGPLPQLEIPTFQFACYHLYSLPAYK